MLSVETYNTLSEAAGRLGSDARYLGGGTLVMRDVNYGARDFQRLVRVQSGEGRGIMASGSGIRIGAATTMADIIASPETAALAPVAQSVGGPAIRNMATVGGNLFAPHPYGDFATALLALDAEVEWSDGRMEAMETFLSRRDSVTGLVAAVSIPRVNSAAFRFRKVSRSRPKGVSVMSIAVRISGASSDGSGARIAFGAMGPTPLRAKAAETALAGARLDQAGIKPALDVCLQGLAPMDDPLASAWYRAEVAPIHLGRLLLESGRTY